MGFSALWGYPEKTKILKTRAYAVQKMVVSEKKQEFRTLFPYENIRKIQDKLITDIKNNVLNKKNMIIHAPTGLGKTVSVFAPIIEYAKEKKLKIFFLTSRHTQHKIAIETLQEIKKKFNIPIITADIISKLLMCPVKGVSLLKSREFLEYCKNSRENRTCEFFNETKETNNKHLTIRAKDVLDKIKHITPCDVEEIKEFCAKQNVCPYEISASLAKQACVIIADYNYIFNSHIRTAFFNKAALELENCIIIVDEAHNIISRVRESLTTRLSGFVVKSAISEASKAGYNETTKLLQSIEETLIELSQDLGNNRNEKIVSRDEFVSKLKTKLPSTTDYDGLIQDLELISAEIIKNKKRSFIGLVSYFLDLWQNSEHEDSYVRIMEIAYSNNRRNITLSKRCLDPSNATQEIIDAAHSTILMSGTLTPTSMYKDLLGFPDDSFEKLYPNPYPDHNKLSLIIPKTTTKYSQRNEMQFKNIASIAAEVANNVPGNSIVFFPSYYLRDQVYKEFSSLCEKTSFLEMPNLSKNDKLDLLEQFKSYSKTGAVMLGVIGGSFSEGIDLPGDLLKGVIVVGLPLQQPSLETQKLIEYYDKQFSKGWDYGYIFPAMNKTMQAAGRCIRSENDKGIIVYLDERYSWDGYRRCFPPDSDITITMLYKDRIQEFFEEPKQDKNDLKKDPVERAEGSFVDLKKEF